MELYWKGMKNDVKKYVESCLFCQKKTILCHQLGYYNLCQYQIEFGRTYQWILWKGCWNHGGKIHLWWWWTGLVTMVISFHCVLIMPSKLPQSSSAKLSNYMAFQSPSYLIEIKSSLVTFGPSYSLVKGLFWREAQPSIHIRMGRPNKSIMFGDLPEMLLQWATESMVWMATMGRVLVQYH